MSYRCNRINISNNKTIYLIVIKAVCLRCGWSRILRRGETKWQCRPLAGGAVDVKFPVFRKLREAGLQTCVGERARAFEVSSLKLLGRPHVDDFAAFAHAVEIGEADSLVAPGHQSTRVRDGNPALDVIEADAMEQAAREIGVVRPFQHQQDGIGLRQIRADRGRKERGSKRGM